MTETEINMEKEKQINRWLVERYPFLLPRSVWTDKVADDYDYSCTLLDNCSTGWLQLALMMCEEIREEIKDTSHFRELRFMQVKEKWGEMTIYTNPTTPAVHRIIEVYSRISGFVCCVCGEIAAFKTSMWYASYCAHHVPRNNEKVVELYTDILLREPEVAPTWLKLLEKLQRERTITTNIEESEEHDGE